MRHEFLRDKAPVLAKCFGMAPEDLEKDLAVEARLPDGPRLGILGSTSFWHPQSEATCQALGLALVACALCGCQTRPAPVVEASVRPGVNEPYLKPDLSVAGSVERFEREGREVYDRRAEIVNAARLQPGMRVADIGAGTGLFTFLFAEVVGPQGRVYAVDIAEPFVCHSL
jgi:hypothetical protein